jgi:molybdate transport system substrate-binding protein
MKMSLIVAAASVLALTPILAPMDSARADELRVLAGGSLRSILTELAPRFEKASGHKVAIHFDTTPNLIKAATTAEPFDVGIVPIDVFYDKAAKAHFAQPVEFARVGYGVAVKTGAPKPEISTPEAFKQTLLEARSVTFLPASAAGSYILRLFERLGIEDAMRAKTIAQAQPTGIVPAVVNGEAELAIFVNNVLTAPGVDIVGPFPAKYQQELVFPAALAVDTKQKETAKAFVDFIMSPEATIVVKAKGMTPARS